MVGYKLFTLVLIVSLGSSTIFGASFEDREDFDRDSEDTEDEASEDPEVEENEELDDLRYNFETGNVHEERDSDLREKVVKIPAQSMQDDEQEDHENDNDEEDNVSEEEEEDLQDGAEMDQNEDSESLPSWNSDVLAGQGQNGFEDFKNKMEEIRKQNENIQVQMDSLNTKLDKALSDGSHGLPEHSEDVGDKTSQDLSSSNQKDKNLGDGSEGNTQETDELPRPLHEDDIEKRYGQIGEDTDSTPDDDY